MQMFASGHQAPALEALPRRSAQSVLVTRLNGKRVCSLSAHRRLSRQHRVTQRVQWHRSTVCQANTAPSSVTEKVELDARVAVVLGTQWGDEGKGKLVDILAQKYDVVARAQVSKSLVICAVWQIGMLFLLLLVKHKWTNKPQLSMLFSLSLVSYREVQMQVTQSMMTRAQNMLCILCPLAY